MTLDYNELAKVADSKVFMFIRCFSEFCVLLVGGGGSVYSQFVIPIAIFNKLVAIYNKSAVAICNNFCRNF